LVAHKVAQHVFASPSQIRPQMSGKYFEYAINQ